MNIRVLQGEIQKRADEALILNLFERAKPAGATGAVDKALDGLISRAVASGDFNGKKNETLLLYTGDRIRAKRVIVVGLGKKRDFGIEQARQAAATAARKLQSLGVTTASSILHGAGDGGVDVVEAAQATAEASILACYRFDEYRTKTEPKPSLSRLTITEFDKTRLGAIRRGAKIGEQIAAATSLARDLCNHPGNRATPSFLARTARSISRKHGLTCRVIDEAGMKRLGMGALLGVSAGSAEPARFIIMEHKKKAGSRPLVFVGKGVTFDSGGVSIKASAGMEDMKFDMSGAAAVIGAMQAVAALDLPAHVVGLVPATENLLDGKSVKPGDVLETMSGKTIEIVNTDAEGRLILADALTYAARYKPAAIVDLATLTGACVVALGHHAIGMMTNDNKLASRVTESGEQTGERVWQLPLWEEYGEQIRSSVADMKNTGGRAGGSITAAALLAEFVDCPWVHLDIAGTAWSSKARPYIPRGGVGVGVRLLTELARGWKTR